MKFDLYENNKYCVSSDTDSIFIKAEPLLKAKYGDDYSNILTKSQIIEEIKEISKMFEDKLNKFLNKKTLELLNVSHNQIEFKTETIIESAYWSGKRRYAQYIVNKEGNDTEEFDVKGLDIMKSNFPIHFRNFGEELIKKILFDTPKKDIDKFILDFKNSLIDVDWTKIMKPTGLKKLKEYIKSPPKAGELFSRIEKKCPANTKAAIYTTDILKFKGLHKSYPIPQIGDKIYLINLKNNPYKVDVLCLNGYNDAPYILELVEKYIDREQIFESVLKNKIETIYLDLGWGYPIFNDKINKFFKF